jgi:hypothetical protein
LKSFWKYESRPARRLFLYVDVGSVLAFCFSARAKSILSIWNLTSSAALLREVRAISSNAILWRWSSRTVHESVIRRSVRRDFRGMSFQQRAGRKNGDDLVLSRRSGAQFDHPILYSKTHKSRFVLFL